MLLKQTLNEHPRDGAVDAFVEVVKTPSMGAVMTFCDVILVALIARSYASRLEVYPANA